MSRPLKFLQLTTFYPPYSFGGDALYLYRLCHALGESGHEVDVAHCVDSYHLLHPREPEVAFAEHPRVTRHEFRSGVGWLSPLLTQQTGRPYLKRRLLQRLFHRQHDVVHFHNASLLGPKTLAMVPQDHQTVTLYTTHEHWLVCPMHVLWKFNRRPCEKRACLRCMLLGKRPPQLWRNTGLLERSVRHVDRFVSPSRFTAEMHNQRGFTQPVGRLPIFIDRVDGDWQEPRQRPHHRPYFLFVGRLEAIKGVRTLIRVWDRVNRADLLVAGTGGDESELRVLAAGNPRIRFLGHLSQQELGPLYYHALACIVPSVTYEVFSTVVLETFARKTPAIVRDLGALPELIEESGGGIVFRSDEDLLRAVDRIASSADLRNKLGERGYQTFVKRWSKEAHLKQYFELLESIAREKFGRVPWRK